MDESTPVLTVSELNSTAAKILEHSFPLLWVSGEISNLTKAASGHWYFTLKDNNAQVRSVMFRGKAQSVGFIPKDGDKVEVRAVVTLYTARGEFQLNVEAMRHAGLGSLYEAFLRLKAKLGDEGLFDEERKRNLPVFARTIGIVTSPQAAALRDILTTLSRRAPHVNVILYPTPVQGEDAAGKIASAITLASVRAECDVLLICRGGGSIEDLWSFNEEVVARAIAACSIPTISGVGHETDFTIADLRQMFAHRHRPAPLKWPPERIRTGWTTLKLLPTISGWQWNGSCETLSRIPTCWPAGLSAHRLISNGKKSGCNPLLPS